MRDLVFIIKLCFLCVAIILARPSLSFAYIDLNSLIPQSGYGSVQKDPVMIQAGMTQALLKGEIDSVKFLDKPGMEAFYEARGYEPVWIETSFFGSNKVKAVIGIFKESWRHGFNPEIYHLHKIVELSGMRRSEDRFKLELLISDALVRYGRDMTSMRINPRDIGQRSKYWREPLRGIDILDHVAGASTVEQGLQSLAPKGDLYKKLQHELVKLSKTSSKAFKFGPVVLDGILRPGQRKKVVASVRARMGFATDSVSADIYIYDESLVAAVQAFQEANGLKADGIVGPHTAQLMNMTRDDRINQILVNLERLRWVEPKKPNRYVMINVPSAMLWAVEGQRVKLEMPVVVGRKKRPTNIFTTTITGIRFNPTWTVPPTIKKEDYLPKLQENPYYLSDRGIEISQEGLTLDPGLVDWGQMTEDDVRAYKMVQGSGNANPLGRMRVIMSNPFNIYLHDTPTKSYFKRNNRALSSGCVRLERPQELADFVLEPNTNWSSEKKQRVMDSMKQTEIWASSPLPVYILYQTVWLGSKGQVVYGNDLYEHDRELLAALRARNAMPKQVRFDKALAGVVSLDYRGGKPGVDFTRVND